MPRGDNLSEEDRKKGGRNSKGGRSSSSGSSSSSEGQGWHGDSQGHREAAEERNEGRED